jgi:hypothetical protein
VPEEGRLGEDFQVQQRRRRLEGDGRQLLEPVQAAGGMDVAQRDREHQPPGDRRHPSPATFPAPDGPTANDVIAMVDGLQERHRVIRGPRLLGRRDQDEREMGALQAAGQRDGDAFLRDGHDPGLRRPAHRAQVVDQRSDVGLGAVDGSLGQGDDANTGVGQRLAPEVLEEGIVEFLARGHSGSRRR